MRAFFTDDGGFSTAGMAVAMLVTLSLLFGTAQVYRVHSRAAEVQNVADACALAAENPVASFYTAAQACDAMVLSMNVAAFAACGLGVVCACAPGAAGASAQLLKAAKDIVDARGRFAKEATEGLERFQDLLPFLAAVQASHVAQANSTGQAGYAGVAFLVAADGEPVEVGDAAALTDAVDEAAGKSGEIQEQAAKAEEAAVKAKECKERAFMADCGAYPDYCMYERAKNVAGMSEALNPRCESVDGWSFSMALDRSRAYYAWRLKNERPSGTSVDAQVDSQMRKRFYEYALKRVNEGHVDDDVVSGSFSADFPLMPANTAEMRQTSLYTDAVYPVSVSDGKRVMHAWPGCPGAKSGVVGTGSIADMEHDGFSTCPDCRFTAASLGKVAAASTSIENGYEHSYRIVAEQARPYAEAREQARQASEGVRTSAKGLWDTLSDAFSNSSGQRIKVLPPGRNGAVALVMSTDDSSTASMMPNGFVDADVTMGTRAAMSAATLAENGSDDAETSISTLFERVDGESALGSSAPQAVLDVWSGALTSWNEGVDGIGDVIDQVSRRLPLDDVCGLGVWARGAFDKSVESLGLEPVQLRSYEPVTVNSSHVSSKADDGAGQALYKAECAYRQAPGDGSGSPVELVIDAARGKAIDAGERLSGPFTIATVQPFGESGPSVPVEVTLPPAVKDAADDAVNGSFDALSQKASSVVGERRWR